MWARWARRRGPLRRRWPLFRRGARRAQRGGGGRVSVCRRPEGNAQLRCSACAVLRLPVRVEPGAPRPGPGACVPARPGHGGVRGGGQHVHAQGRARRAAEPAGRGRRGARAQHAAAAGARAPAALGAVPDLPLAGAPPPPAPGPCARDCASVAHRHDSSAKDAAPVCRMHTPTLPTACLPGVRDGVRHAIKSGACSLWRACRQRPPPLASRTHSSPPDAHTQQGA